MKWRIKTFGTKFIVQRKRFWFWFWDTASIELDFGLGPDHVLSVPRVFDELESATKFVKQVSENEGSTVWHS